jgi:uncharacterized protein with GYD domain
MPVPTEIKPKHALFVVYTVLGAHAVCEEKDEAKAVQTELERQGHKTRRFKYTLGKEPRVGDQSL